MGAEFNKYIDNMPLRVVLNVVGFGLWLVIAVVLLAV